MPMVLDYSDARLFPGRPLKNHLMPEAWPIREQHAFSPAVKVRRGKTIRCLILDDGETINFDGLEQAI